MRCTHRKDLNIALDAWSTWEHEMVAVSIRDPAITCTTTIHTL